MGVSELASGDIVLLLDGQGYWHGAFEYLGPDRESPGFVLVRSDWPAAGVFSVRADLISRPRVLTQEGESAEAGLSQAAEGAPAQKQEAAVPAAEPGITPAQRKMLFGLARNLGFDVDDLRAMTPQGSVSALSRLQAADLIDRLSGGPGMRPMAQGTATVRQLGMIAHYRDLLGFSESEFAEWLGKRFNVTGTDQVREKGLASRIIGGLLKMYEKRSGGGDGKAIARRGGRPAADAAGG